MDTSPSPDTALPIGDREVEDSQQSAENISNWKFFGRKVPKSEIVFGTQIFMLYIVIIVCLVNLTIGNGDSNLWTALLSSSLGYMLPNPTLKSLKKV